LDAYARDIEDQIVRGMEGFRENKRTEIIEADNEEEAERFTEIHNGLDDGIWNLTEILKEYFPNLQRRSALITIFSFFEHELDEPARLWRRGWAIHCGPRPGYGMFRHA
jgi:hypothetical protein